MLRRFAFLALGLLAPLAAADEPLPADQFWAEKGEPLLKKFCADCHSGAEAEGEFDLERYTSAEAMRGDRISWNKARKQVAFGAMPPDDVERPNNKERKLLVEAIDRALGEAGGCDLEYKPAAVTARRLNREEYNRTVRDLLSVDLRPAEAFPSDEVGDGFDNNADVLTLPPLLLEKYLDAAEQLADAAIITPEEQKELEIHQDIGGDGLTPTGPVKLDSFVRYQMSPGGSVSAEFTLPAPGKYRVTLSVYTEDTSPFDLPLELVYEAGDGKPPEVLESFAWSDPVQNRFRKDFEFPAGKLKLTARLPEGAKATGEAKGENNRRPPEPVAVISQIRVDGPQEWKDSMLPAPHQQLVTVKPQGRIGVREAAEQVLLQFARRAFRNSVTCDDVKPYVDMVVLAKERGLPYERGLEIATSAILVSPKFLYRIEAVPADAKPGSVVPLDDYQLASRLSYFLWSSAPDAALLDLADRGELQKDDVLRAQVERMLRDPRADSLFDNFAAQWLGLRNLAGTTPNVERYPAFNEDLRGDMLRETQLVFLDLLRSDRSALELLDGRRTFLNERLAKHYGIEGVSGSEFREVSLEKVSRAGILSHASVLTLTSNPGRTSPVKRGKWVMENLLGTPPPEPPPGVISLEESAKDVSHLPLRKQLELHRVDPACAACHRYMDAIGFGLENFDGVGGWRDADQGQPIDTAGELPSGDKFSGPLELVKTLRTSAGDDFFHVLANRLLTYALGRGLTAADRCEVDEIVKRAQADGGSLKAIITHLALSPTYRNFTIAREESP